MMENAMGSFSLNDERSAGSMGGCARTDSDSNPSGRNSPQSGQLAYPPCPSPLQTELARVNLKCVADEDADSSFDGMRCLYAWSSKAGQDGKGQPKENQDSVAVVEKVGQCQALFLGVFDGHGPDGGIISKVVSNSLPKLIAAQEERLMAAAYAKAMAVAFPAADALLGRLTNVDAELSGSTGCCALFFPGNTLCVANCGDSRCVMGRTEGEAMAAYEMSNDHTPELVSEAARVVAAGGRIARYQAGNQPLGPPRVWHKTINSPGLCMTRSFGDGLAHTLGVTTEPEVLVYSLVPEDRYLVVMTDGITEFMESQEVIDLVHKCATEHKMCPRQCAQTLVKEARRRWKVQEAGGIDDCSAIVVFMQHEPPVEQQMHTSAEVHARSQMGFAGCMPRLK